ncbi:hypothetical protein [Burkholderia sp. IT-111MI5]|uniref:hypothetical protein n=1 Tax=Burkholderia sp. IT-111MI5 TaxID=3026439 RepID=UPI002A67ADB6|nr:hypothetical protein [Burkholderia pyrrocinia]
MQVRFLSVVKRMLIIGIGDSPAWKYCAAKFVRVELKPRISVFTDAAIPVFLRKIKINRRKTCGEPQKACGGG